MIENRIGLKIKELRGKQGWTQEQLAEKAGISLSLVGMIESGKSGASTKTINKLSVVFKVPPSYFMDDVSFDKFSDHFTVEEKEFLTNEQSRPWIKLAKEFEEEGLAPEAVREALQVLMKIKLGKNKE